jgi:glycosyltransferase involved in cell wall biosynthesis
MTERTPVVIEISALREMYYTGIPNVIAEICARFLLEEQLDLYFDLGGLWVDSDSLRTCLAERSGASLGPKLGTFRPAEAIRDALTAAGRMPRTVALYTDHRPPRKLFPREGKIVYDLSMILAPECHPVESVRMYTGDLEEQIACSDVLFCISEATARELAWVYGVPKDRLRVARLGSNVDLTYVDRMRTIIAGRAIEPFLLVLGSIEPRKNVALVLEWLSRHPETLGATRVVFAGRQAWGESFESLVDSKGLGDALQSGRIVFLGYVDEKLKAALLVGAAALIYPSIFEGFGLPLLEAMATGTPVLSSASTSMPEVVGDSGYYFDPYSVDSLNQTFRRLWADRASGELRDTVARARRRAAGFSYDTTYQVIRAGLLGEGPTPGDTLASS